MKKTAIISLYLLSAVVLLSSCRKEDNPSLPALTRFPLPQILKVAGSDQSISASNPNAFSGKFTVGLYFASDVPPKKFDVVVIKNNDKTNVKVIKDNLTTFPTELTITGSQLAALFGSPIVAGDRFDISVNVTTVDGQTFEAFPVTGAAYAAGVAAQPNSSTFIRYASA